MLAAVCSGMIPAQDTDTLSAPVIDSAAVMAADTPGLGIIDPSDTLKTSLWPALIRSAIIPGWGQIEQEHPGRAVIFYGLSLACLYNIAYNYQWYQKTNDYSNKIKMRRFTIAFLQVYAINLADIIESHAAGADKPWPQDLFSDIPAKSPWGAVARSAILPGWGQCYNESYVKSVIAFAACFYFGSQIYNNEQKYKNTGDIQYRDERITNSWYFGLAYFLVMVDAYIDAYLYKFDEAVRLSYYYLPLDHSFKLGVNIAF
jgi:hypothetical protein